MKFARIITSVIILCSIAQYAYSADETKPARPKIGLVLSGGGAKGLAHVGVLKVLEEEGIQIDYITGTSMGSIVGGLYAIGYSAADLERIGLETKWYDLLQDITPRINIPLRERDGYDRFLLDLDIDGFSVRLPKGLIKGQSLSSYLSRLMIGNHNVNDYSRLRVPFKCIATDIETGKAVVLDKGFLPESVRASMSIPSAFTPVELSGQLLIDGGIARNFPVSDVRDMGAQIVIGVDVGQPLYKKDELDSFGKIMEQSMSFLGDESTRKQRSLCNTLILPDIQGISSSDFDNPKDIIERGERAAREKLPEIRALAARLKQYKEPSVRKQSGYTEPEKVRITAININGLSQVSKTTVLAILSIKTPSDVSPEDIEESIRDVYGSDMFEKVLYRIMPVENNGNALIISVTEKDTHLLQLGACYDNYLKGAILAKLTFRNLWFFGNKFSIDAIAGYESPGLKLSSYYYAGSRPSIGIGVECKANSFEADTYTLNGGTRTSGSYQIFDTSAKVLSTLEMSNCSQFNLGVEKKSMTVSPLSDTALIHSKAVVESSALFVSGKIDTYDNIYLPRKGVLLEGDARHVSDRFSFRSADKYPSFMKYTASAGFALPIHRRLSLIASGNAGYINRKTVPISEMFFIGGMNTHGSDFIPFPGLNFFEVSATKFRMITTGINIEIFRWLVLIPKYSYGEAGNSIIGIKGSNNSYYGYGATLGIQGLFIPIEISCIRGGGSRGSRTLLYLNAGYRF
jgi:NTE family protein